MVIVWSSAPIYDLTLCPQKCSTFKAWSSYATIGDRSFIITLEAIDDMANTPYDSEIYFFSTDEGVVEHTAPQHVSIEDGRIELRIKKSRYLSRDINKLGGILTSQNSWEKETDKPVINVTVPITNVTNPIDP